MCQNAIFNLFAFLIVFQAYFQTYYGYHLLDKFNNNTLVRIRRQSSCRFNEFRCNNGQCIRTYNVCDGKSDCADESDEVLNCNPNGCRADTFQCAYSACVDGDARCNGNKDCRDGSDEAGCETNPTTNSKKCGTKFSCKDGQCINQYEVCDGIKHCTDGSDETYQECNSITCQSYAFRCAYGACVDGEAKCNGEQDCADGSDESTQICPNVTVTTPPPVVNGQDCPPIDFQNGQYNVLGSGYVHGYPIPNYSLVRFSCNKNYALFPPNAIANCIDGTWSNALPKCLVTCPPRISSSVDITCSLNDLSLDCTKPLVEGAIATMKCKHHYRQESEVPPTIQCQGGSWDRPLIYCTPECGELVPDGGTYIVNGSSTKKGEFPWHIALYRLMNNEYVYKCGGSIITPKLIISAAHCFVNDLGTIKYPAEEYYVGAGKYYSDYDSEHDLLAQKKHVKDYYIPSDYRGYQANYAADIAVVVVEDPFKLTNVVQPVCIDWNNKFEDQQLRPDNKGSVVGWGFSDPNVFEPSKELQQLSAPFIDRGQCLDVVPSNFIRWVTPDKFCAGFTTGKSVCKGDSGGGMVFELKNKNKVTYYLRGLVSVGPVEKGVCNTFQYGVYTKISAYTPFIQNIEIHNRIRD